jgi:hypothetical protein
MKKHAGKINRLEKSIIVSLHVARVVYDCSQELYRSPLQELDIDLNLGEIAMSGSAKGVRIAERRIRGIEGEIEEISIDSFLYDLLRLDTDQKFWSEIVKRCASLDPCLKLLEMYVFLSLFKHRSDFV